MDEVRVESLIQKYKDNGELVREDPALVMLKKWPASKQHPANSAQLPGLEELVCIMYKITSFFLFYLILYVESQKKTNCLFDSSG